MPQPYYLLSLIIACAFGVMFGVIWCKSHDYIKYEVDDKPSSPRAGNKMYERNGRQNKWDGDKHI